MTIQWFPGHMAKARREVTEKLKLVDFVIELRDARAPDSSQNPMLQEVIGDKPKIVVLMKRDLADERETARWIDYFNETDRAVAVDVNKKQDIQSIIQVAREISEERFRKAKEKGVKPRASRAMIIGIPNVGKSTLINRLANKKIAKTGDRPGITKQQLWVKVGNDFELLDTPGILWPKFDDQEIAKRLAAIGTIKDQLLPLQDVAAYVINYMRDYYTDELYERYDVIEDIYDMWDVFVEIGKRFGALESGGKVNFDKVANQVLRDLRTGRLGRITLDRV